MQTSIKHKSEKLRIISTIANTRRIRKSFLMIV